MPSFATLRNDTRASLTAPERSLTSVPSFLISVKTGPISEIPTLPPDTRAFLISLTVVTIPLVTTISLLTIPTRSLVAFPADFG